MQPKRQSHHRRLKKRPSYPCLTTAVLNSGIPRRYVTMGPYIPDSKGILQNYRNFPFRTILGAFAKLQKMRLLASCPPARNNSAPSGRIFMKFDTEYFSKICRESSRINKIWQEKLVHYMKTNIHLWSYLAHFFLEWEMLQTKVVEEIKNDNYVQFFFENRIFYEAMWKNIVQPDRPQTTI